MSKCKCGSDEVVLIQKLYGSFCSDCFIKRISHKMRSEFGKRAVVRDNEKVALAFSAGKKSSVLLHLIKEGRSKRAKKKLRFQTHIICFFNDQEIFTCSKINDGIDETKENEKLLKNIKETIEVLENSHFSYSIFSLNQIFDESDQIVPLYQKISEDNNHFHNNNNKDNDKNNKNNNDNNNNNRDNNDNDNNNKDNDNVNNNRDNNYLSSNGGNIEDVIYKNSYENKNNNNNDHNNDNNNNNTYNKTVNTFDEIMKNLKSTVSMETKLKQKSLKTFATSFDATKQIYLKYLLKKICLKMNISKVLLGDTCQQLVAKVLSNLSQGRGDHLAYDMDFVDDRFEDVLFLRPLRSLLDDELDTLIKLENIKFVSQQPSSSFYHLDDQPVSIDDLSNQFILQLNKENPNILTIISRTIAKLHKPNDANTNSITTNNNNINNINCNNNNNYDNNNINCNNDNNYDNSEKNNYCYNYNNNKNDNNDDDDEIKKLKKCSFCDSYLIYNSNNNNNNYDNNDNNNNNNEFNLISNQLESNLNNLNLIKNMNNKKYNDIHNNHSDNITNTTISNNNENININCNIYNNNNNNNNDNNNHNNNNNKSYIKCDNKNNYLDSGNKCENFEKNKNAKECNNKENCCSKYHYKNLTYDELLPFLCYGCQILIKELGINILPPHVLSDVKYLIRRKKLKEQVEKYLIKE